MNLLEQFELFAKKQLDYEAGNISTGADLDTEDGKKFALSGLWFRMNDKISRWKNLIIKNRKLPRIVSRYFSRLRQLCNYITINKYNQWKN